MLHFKEGDCFGLGVKVNVATLEGRGIKEYCFREESTLSHFNEGEWLSVGERINVVTLEGWSIVVGKNQRCYT